MPDMKAKTQMQDLIAKIKEADTAYYKHDAPIMTDHAYDQLMDELISMEKRSGIILSSSPTQRVSGEVLEGLALVTHTKPMLSAAKTKSVDEVLQFIGGRSAIESWKMDGLTLVLRYDQGVLKQAITRGKDGLVGEDVTHTVRVMLNVPLKIPFSGALEVRGEGVVSWENFNRLNDTLGEPYSTPRNLASGSIRKLNAEAVRARSLEFWAFELIGDMFSLLRKSDQLEFLESQGFDVVPHILLDEGMDEVDIKDLITMAVPASFRYPVDGLIFEYNDIAYGRSLGATGHHEHRMLALKWDDELYKTTFTGLDVAVTQTGMVSLTGVFDSVEIDGTTVSRAYLHNIRIFKNLALGVGDTIAVMKVNMIIPQIAENYTKSGTLQLPTTCPCCGGPLVIRESAGGTQQLYCENPSCSAKLIQRFVHFCDKTRMDIGGLSEKTLTVFVEHGWVKNFGDLYQLDRHKNEIIATPGFGARSYANLQAVIDARRTCTLNQFIAGLGILTVGRTAGRALHSYFHGSWSAFEMAVQEGFDFTQLPDFGKTMNDNIHAWYADAEEAKLWRPVLEHITFQEDQVEEGAADNARKNPFAGKTIVATGTLENYTRTEIQERLMALGAKPTDSVSKNTDFLIVGKGAGSKLTKAKALGVTTLTEQQFEDMANNIPF